MRYLGLDVHTKATVWHLLDREGQTVETGKTATTGPALTTLVRRFADQDELTVGQEVGKMAYLVHDVLTAAKVRVLSFNAWHLRMVASSRKKTDRRDAYWLAKILQTGMMPHPVYIPTGEIRELRGLLSRRVAIVGERKRWLLRARSHLEAAGCPPQRRGRSITRLLESSLAAPDGIDATGGRLGGSLPANARDPRTNRQASRGRKVSVFRDEPVAYDRAPQPAGGPSSPGAPPLSNATTRFVGSGCTCAWTFRPHLCACFSNHAREKRLTSIRIILFSRR
jgi:hypothetical protein